MSMLKKITCGLMLSLILVPMSLQAAKAPRENRDHKLQTYQGNKPVVKGNAHRETGRSAAPKRNLNAIYILPKGYKDITIKGKAQATKKQAAQLIAANNPYLPIGCSVGEIVDLYWEEAGQEGIRPDMALSQALLETGYFNFGGSVEPWQHNYCGLGTIGNGVQGAAFRTHSLAPPCRGLPNEMRLGVDSTTSLLQKTMYPRRKEQVYPMYRKEALS